MSLARHVQVKMLYLGNLHIILPFWGAFAFNALPHVQDITLFDVHCDDAAFLVDALVDMCKARTVPLAICGSDAGFGEARAIVADSVIDSMVSLV